MTMVGKITLLLRDVEAGRDGAMDELMRTVYVDLERIALAQLSARYGERVGMITLEPCALVNESFMRLIRQRNRFDNRGHFFAIATKLMLRVLTDYQRRRGAAKRGGDVARVALFLDGQPSAGREPGADTRIQVESLIEALHRLESLDPRQAEVVIELRGIERDFKSLEGNHLDIG